MLSLSVRWPVLVLAIALVHAQPAAAGAAKWLPAGTDVVVTVNVRQFLDDHKNSDGIQQALAPWRLALRGDDKALRQYYRARDLKAKAGMSEEEFLDRARSMRSVSDLLGLNPLEDIDRVTCGLRRDVADAWIVIVEGRFQQKRLRKAVEQLAQQCGGTVAIARMGKCEMWHLSANGSSVCVALLNDETLAIAGRKEALTAAAGQADSAKKDALAPERRALLEQAEKQHIAVFVDRVDELVAQARAGWADDAARALGAGDGTIVKLALTQAAAWANRYGKDVLCASAGLSIHDAETRLHLGLLARTPATAKEIASRLDGVRVLAGLGAKALDNARSRQAGDILLRARVTAADVAVAIRVSVPHAFVEGIAADVQGTLRPHVDQLARRIMSIPLWQPPAPPPGALAVEEMRDIAYQDGPTADPIRHRLDVVLPRGNKGFPVVVLVHGGGWTIGDNRCCGLYTSVAHFLASQGVGVVLPNYRLSPAVKHPEHARDVAHAVRWTRDHIAEHGADPDRIYLMGHSAGGHLVALLGTDESYLQAKGLGHRDIKGVIAVSGVYRIAQGRMEGFLGGNGSRSFRPDQLLPLRDPAIPLPQLPALGFSATADVFGPPFGNDPKVRAAASPISHVRRGLPPFLILAAERDLPTLADMATEFHKALVHEGCTSELLQLKDRNHNTLMFSMIRADDPAARAVLKFIK